MAVTTVDDLIIEEIKNLKEKPDFSNLKFGQIYSDRMLVRKWKNGVWEPAQITRYDKLQFEPSTIVFHYGQAIFEGMKAFKQDDGSVKLFRPEENAKRFNISAERMAMPQIDEGFFVESIKKLVELESEWVPDVMGSSLYIRPTMIASENAIGVKVSSEFLFFVILSPSGPFFESGFNPVKIKVEENYIRAAEGGTGYAKAAGNYAGSLLASQKAKTEGYSQVLWLDAKEKKYVEEVGAMNIAFVIKDKIYSPGPRGTILNGITRKSVKVLCKDLDLDFIEERITIDFVIKSIKNGELTEIFGIGTAAVISPVGTLGYRGEDYIINNNQTGPIARKLFDTLTGIQYGKLSDKHNWMS